MQALLAQVVPSERDDVLKSRAFSKEPTKTRLEIDSPQDLLFKKMTAVESGGLREHYT